MLLSWVSEVVWADDEADFHAAAAAFVQGRAAVAVAPARPPRRVRGAASAAAPVAFAMRGAGSD